MALSGVLLFALFEVLSGQVNAQTSFDDCCRNGRDWATQKQDCSTLPLMSELPTCRIAQEQCCMAFLEDNHCTTGINMAKEQGVCDLVLASGSSCERRLSKMCCDCCLLGRALHKQGLSCEQNLSLGYHCGLVSRACCDHSNSEADAKPSQEDKALPASEVEDPYLDDQCRGAGQCSQRCHGNGTCSCFEGYKLKSDGQTCEDINECILGSHSCRAGERCINTQGSYRCQREISCGTGYELTDSNLCKDIDECELGTHNCPAEFQCQNTNGSFRCLPREQCRVGFIQDALGNCIDINECLSHNGPCLPGQTCINNVGSYTCQRNFISCGRGYHLNEEGTRCVDVDECRGPESACEGHICINLMGSFRCECRMGYYFNSISKTCEDVNECRHYPGRLCAHKCENTPGSYKCSCTSGFRLGSDGRNCEDVNECESNPCSQECANVYGSYQCYCRRGYQLSDVDGITCEDIDECALPTGGHICSYRCHNVPGSFQCTCPTHGYTLSPNGRTCQDVDECVTGMHNCSGSEICFNIQGDYRCLAFDCPKNYHRSGESIRMDRTETIRCVKSCMPRDVDCILDTVHTISYTVISLPTFRDFARPEEIVFLRAVSPAYPSVQTSTPDIVFDIIEGNLHNSFDIIKRYENGMTVGVVRQVKPIIGPLHIVLKLGMNYVVRGVISHRNVVNVHIYVSEFWF
nr:PREDICTED: fibulin-1 isoform X1 [Lepisosteus oculatus]